MLRELKSRLVDCTPALLSHPIKWTPFFIQQEIVQRLLSWQFSESLNEGNLDFLRDRWLKVEVRDLGLHWFISVQDNRLMVSRTGQADVIFTADVNELILIAARKEDPDTLFFQRRLHIKGDTELGVQIKNLLDTIDLEKMPALLRSGLFRLADFIEEGMGMDASSTIINRNKQQLHNSSHLQRDEITHVNSS